MVNIETIKCIDIIDDEEVEIDLRKDIDLYYTENDKNYSLRYDFKNSLDNDIENYMLYRYDTVEFDEFTKEEINLMKKTEFEGKFVYKIVTQSGDIFKHYYTFIGVENENEFRLIPVKISVENKYTIDPRTVISTSWHYIETEEPEFIELSQFINEKDNNLDS